MTIKTIISLDKHIHEPARLAIMSILYVTQKVEYLFLINEIGLSQGNLSSHITNLEMCKYIEVQ